MNYQRVIYSLIACHGITDVCERPEHWIPAYAICASYAHALGYEVYLKLTIILTALHFSQDICDTLDLHAFNAYLASLCILSWTFNAYLATLCLLLWFREWWISQQIIVAYLGFIHTPLHLYRKTTYLNDTLVLCTWGIIYTQDWIIAYIDDIVRNKAIETDTLMNRALLSVLNAHMIVHLIPLFSQGFRMLTKSLQEMD